MIGHAMFAIVIMFASCFGAPPPVVLMHGITTTSKDLVHMASVISAAVPGVYIKNVEIGNGDETSLWEGINFQVDNFCKQLREDAVLRRSSGINIIGTSQGGIIARGFLQRCYEPPVLNFISWVSPQGGQFGVPNIEIPYLNSTLLNIADCCIYDRWAQDLISFAGYWKDPLNITLYLERSTFLADMNNERAKKNELYKSRVTKLRRMVLSYSQVDKVLIPRETGWFGFYKDGSEHTVVHLFDTDFYKEDWLGLKTLNDTGRLTFFETTCEHQDYSTPCFDSYFNKYVLPILKEDA